jgi:hypothetical protein
MDGIICDMIINWYVYLFCPFLALPSWNFHRKFWSEYEPGSHDFVLTEFSHENNGSEKSAGQSKNIIEYIHHTSSHHLHPSSPISTMAIHSCPLEKPSKPPGSILVSALLSKHDIGQNGHGHHPASQPGVRKKHCWWIPLDLFRYRCPVL